MESDLTATASHSEVMPNPKGAKGVDRAFNLVLRIREQAQSIHDSARLSPSGKSPFPFEYRVALLYHTLRVIGYEGVSPFKRLLAVFSAARLIDCLDRFPSDRGLHGGQPAP